MALTGGCYCGDVRYESSGDPRVRLQCHCRECQYISGGSPNLVMGMDAAQFRYTRGAPSSFARPDLAAPVTREFCARCGTHLLTRSPRMPDAVLVKVGTLDDPAIFGRPAAAIFTIDRQPFHLIADDVPQFERRVVSS